MQPGLFNTRNFIRKLVGIPRIRLGRLVVLGSGRKCLPYAMVCRRSSRSLSAVTDKRNAMKSWAILLAIIAFGFSLLGTFLVRSGVLTSVHSFASDPQGVFILIMTAGIIGAALVLYALRASEFKLVRNFHLSQKKVYYL